MPTLTIAAEVRQVVPLTIAGFKQLRVLLCDPAGTPREQRRLPEPAQLIVSAQEFPEMATLGCAVRLTLATGDVAVAEPAVVDEPKRNRGGKAHGEGG